MKFAGMQDCGGDVFQWLCVMAVKRDYRIAAVLGLGRKSPRRDIDELPDVGLVHARRKVGYRVLHRLS